MAENGVRGGGEVGWIDRGNGMKQELVKSPKNPQQTSNLFSSSL
jgi:hypothetical protein